MPDPSLTVALTGASGFVGGHILEHLVDQGAAVRVLARDPARLKLADARIEVIPGDLFDPAALRQLVSGAAAVIHVVGIIMEKPSAGQTFERIHTEGTQRLLAAARAAGVKRWVQMSALGSRPDAVSRYHQSKWLAEQAVRDSGLAWTIFRPSIIHGPDGEFMEMVKGFWCNRFPPFVPYFGSGLTGGGGAGRVQPVWVEDVAACFAASLTNDKTIGETYPMGGPDVYTWPAMYEACRPHFPHARPKKIKAVPVWYADLIAGLPGVPFNRDQVVMSQEDSTCRIEKVETDFALKLAAFEPTLAQYAADIN